jgi:hypothetical protein
MFEVVWRGSVPGATVWGWMRRKASMTTLPLTDWMGSTTTATERELRDSKGLLGVDVDGGEPATEARVGVVPADDAFGTVYDYKLVAKI